jgi:hypothetical protein
VRERRHRILLLARHPQRLAAGDEQIEVGAGSEQTGDIRCRRHDLLEVVEEKQHRSVGDVLGQFVAGAEGLTRRLQHELGLAEGGERHPPHPVRVARRELGGRLRCQPRLAGAARPGEREQADAFTG